METDLIFTRGIDLPGFAPYALLETEEGRAVLKEYLRNLIDLGRAEETGVILESPTWAANRDRAAPIGYSPAKLRYINQQAIAPMEEMRSEADDVPTLISATLGPRDDACSPDVQMKADDDKRYHSEQVLALAATNVDVISAYTLAYSAEAIGIVRVARRFMYLCVLR